MTSLRNPGVAPLHADTLVRVRDSYTETLIAIWEEGLFAVPVVLMTKQAAIKLRDELTREIERKAEVKS